jgi:hypothetical protein
MFAILKMRFLLLLTAIFACSIHAVTLDDLASPTDEPCALVSAMVAPMRAANPRGE